MILTVTAHSAIDKVLFVDELTPGIPMRTDKIVTSMGGKGMDSSVVLRCLGIDTVGLVFVAGKIGEEMLDLAESYGIVSDPVWVDGETRVSHVISETKHGRITHIIAGKLLINSEQYLEFTRRFRQRARQATWVICAGSIPPVLPPTFYKELTEEAHRAGVPVLIDASREKILEAIPARPDIVKMNWEEFEETFAVKAYSMDDLVIEANRIYKKYKVNALVLTCSSAGILTFTDKGAFQTVAPRQKAVNAAGAGDAVSAALAWRFSEGDGWVEALTWAGATSAASVLTEGTADCRMSDIQRIFPQVTVSKV
ncbi:MAG: hexose kinase [Anaerolineales bacterium]|nr:hexose kinase [Anaerolineales bacterium]